jgi:hypothetical protein
MTQPLPTTPAFEQALHTLQAAYLDWCTRQDWAKKLQPPEVKAASDQTVSAAAVSANAG